MDFSKGFDGDGLFPPENEALYNFILSSKPEISFEVGTRRGGGSTYFIASALFENKKGLLYTVECDPDCYNSAVNRFSGSLAYLKPYVLFNLGKSNEVYPPILEKIEKIDALFLDGEENGQQTMIEYAMFKSKLISGSYLVCHDWHIGKMALLRPLIESDASWEKILVFDYTQTGFAIYRKK